MPFHGRAMAISCVQRRLAVGAFSPCSPCCRCCTEPTLSKEAEIGALGPHHGNPLYQEQYYAAKEPAAVAKAKRETSAVASSRVQQPCTREICAVYAIRFRSSW
ncbi:hypothetical protein MTO96_030841, partial [Rhipicephalus appendiculatus]